MKCFLDNLPFYTTVIQTMSNIHTCSCVTTYSHTFPGWQWLITRYKGLQQSFSIFHEHPSSLSSLPPFYFILTCSALFLFAPKGFIFVTLPSYYKRWCRAVKGVRANNKESVQGVLEKRKTDITFTPSNRLPYSTYHHICSSCGTKKVL